MKRLFFVFCALLTVSLTGCNGVGNKDALIARIGNENVYQEDLNLLYDAKWGSDSSPEYKQAIEDFFTQTAQVSLFLKENPEYESKWKEYSSLVNKRVLTVAYVQFFLKENLGYTEEELKDYFEKNRALFDSSTSFMASKTKVAELYYLYKSADSLQSYIQENLSSQNRPEEVELAVFIGDSVSTLEMVKNFNEGKSLDSLGVSRRAHVRRGDEKGMFQDTSVNRALFGSDSMRVGEGRHFIVRGDSSTDYYAMKMVSRTPPYTATVEDKKSMFEEIFVLRRRNFLMKEFQRITEENKDYVIEVPKPANPQKFYEDHLEMFKTPESYDLYQIVVANSSQLAKFPAGGLGMDLETFKKFSRELSVDSAVVARDGFVGRVKKNFALPNGIGMMPDLFTAIAGKDAGFVTSAMFSTSDSLYHIFYLAKVYPSEVKPFDRVKPGIDVAFANNVMAIDSSFVAVSKNGKPIYTEKDVVALFKEEIGQGTYDKAIRDQLVAMLKESSVGEDLANKAKFEHSWQYRALVRQQRLYYMYRQFRRNLLRHGFSNQELIQKKIPENLLKYEYAVKKDSLCGEKTFEECGAKMENFLKGSYYSGLLFKKQLEDWGKVKVTFYNTQWESLCAQKGLDYYWQKARGFVETQNLKAFFEIMDNLIQAYADDDSVMQKVILEMAQVQSDNQLFDDAEKNYEAFYTIWPEHPEAEKAMFSRGFVLNENLHKDKEALQVLEAFCKKYPKSELKESAEWLVADIKSSGKLADDLMKKIDAEGN